VAQRAKRHAPRVGLGSRQPAAYVDISAFIAFLDRSDTWHGFFDRLFSSPPDLFTSALVVAEGHGWFLRRYDRHRARQFLAFVDALPAITVEAFDAAALSRAQRVLARFGDQNLTLSDAHGLTIMEERGVGTCWSTDHHMRLTGVQLAISNTRRL
jgi:predicted nucleic acid-binding protein